MEPIGEPPVIEEAPEEVLAPIFEVTTFLPGRLPGATLAILFTAVALMLAEYKELTAAYYWVYSDAVGLWIHHRWWSPAGMAFMHGGFLHLVFNCYWIWILGRLLERELGGLRTLGLFLATAWFGNVLQFACTGQLAIGLSGAVYGYLGFLLAGRSRHPDFVRMTNRNAGFLIAWMVLCFPLTYMEVMDVANFGHLGGFIAGGALGLASYAARWRTGSRAIAAVLLVLSFLPLVWAPWLQDWAIVRAANALRQHDDAGALAALADVRRAHPDYGWALENEFFLRMKRHEYALAQEIALTSKDQAMTPVGLNNVSWLLATDPDDKVRDGAKAVELGQQACTRDGWHNVMYLDTLAAAQAEAGNFEEAVKLMLRVMEKPEGKDALYQTHLDSFRAQKPWREVPPY